MAATSTSHTWLALARRALAAIAVAATAIVAFAVPASAHTPTFEAGCDEDAGKTFLSIVLTNYRIDKPDSDDTTPNTVTVTDGDEVLLEETGFGRNFEKTWDDLSATEDHSFKVVIMAWDDTDPNNKDEWSITWEQDVKACVEQEEEPPVETEEPPVETEAPPAPPVPTTTTEAPVGVNANLAETGASIAIPAVIGGLLLLGGGVMLFLVRRRRKA